MSVWDDIDPRWELALSTAKLLKDELGRWPRLTVEEIAEHLLYPEFEACGECDWCRDWGTCHRDNKPVWPTLLQPLWSSTPPPSRRGRGRPTSFDKHLCRALGAHWLYYLVEREREELITKEGRERKDTGLRARANVYRRRYPDKFDRKDGDDDDHVLASRMKEMLKFRHQVSSLHWELEREIADIRGQEDE